MGSILQAFGVSWAPFIAQILIFLIVYAILKKFAFAPVIEMLELRKSRIAEGEANLERVNAELSGSEAKAKEILHEANADAERMITEAKESAVGAAEKERQKAVKEAGQIVAKAKEAARLEQEKMRAEMKSEFGRLVIDATSKVTTKVLSDADHKKINKAAAAEISI